ncbi:MAG: glycosyltransferase family 4 protein [Burkholderiaceae bacterium]
MRILHTEASCGWGGQEIRILSESGGMVERGHAVSLACPPHAPIAREAPAHGVRVLPLPIEKKRPGGLLAMRALLARERFDVVNTHSSTDAWLVALACSSLRGAPPMVRTRHISAPVAASAPNRWLYASASRFVVTTGQALRDELVERLGCDPARVVSVPTGIDEARFAPGDALEARGALGLPPERFIVGIAATLRSWKGHRYLVDAVGSIDDPSLLLVVIGDGPQRDALERQVADAGLQARVRFVGQQADVAPWLRALDVFALPSYANEGVPQALMQAMFTGLACVTTAAGAIGEIAHAERTALVVPGQDAHALAAAIERLRADPALRRRLGDEARAGCLAGLTSVRMLDRMEAVFAAAVAGRSLS